MTERWSRASGERILVVELVEVAKPGLMFPDESADDAPLARAEIRMLDGEVFQRYTSIEKARRILEGRGFTRSETLVAMRPPELDEA